MGALQYWICVFVSIWNLNMCNTDIPSRLARKMITANDPILTSNNGSLCQNKTDPRSISFQRLTIHEDILYIGATNRILQVNLPDFVIDQVAVQGPVDDNPTCFAPQVCISDDESCVWQCVNNLNRLLLPHRDQLIVCGSADFGTCNLLPLKNISKTFTPRPNPPNAMKCSPAISRIAEVGGPMTVASIYYSEESPLKDIFYLGSRESNQFILDILYPPRTTPDGSKLRFIRISKAGHFDFNLERNFILSWTTSRYGFILWSTATGVTKLARLCHTSLNGDPEQTSAKSYSQISYTETSITCGQFSEATLAYQVNNVLYLFMKNEKGDHALCSTSFSAINDHILQVRTDCLKGLMTISKLPNNERRGCLVKTISEQIATCGLPRSAFVHAKAISSVESFKLDTHQRYLWPSGESSPTTFAIDLLDGWEVGFFGTTNGTILKADINQLRGQFVESIALENNVSVRLDVGFDESRSHFYAMTENAVYQIKVSSCEQYGDCEGCVRSGDPYCGWCVLQSRCTTKSACANSMDGERWMNISRDPSECPRVAAVRPSTLSIRATEMLSLTFGGNMVGGVNYTCNFNINGTSIGRSKLMNFPASPICQSPQNPPAVPIGQDFSDITLEIEADLAVVAKGKFYIYDCSRTPFVNSSTMCASCVTSRWNCEWCSTSTSCSDNCTGEVSLKDEAFCPSVLKIVNSSIDIPVGRDHEFTLKVKNFTGSNYDCVINVCDGANKVTVPAVLNGDTVTCPVAGDMLQCSEEDSNVAVYLQSGDHTVDTESASLVQVNLFNCSGSKAECGLCILTHQRHPQCSWCPNGNVCTDDCRGGGYTMIASCPTARIDKIVPQNGPVDGGTEITITGTNLATSLGEIDSIFVRNTTSGIDVACSVIPRKYVPSKKIVCLTTPIGKPIQGRVHIAVNYAQDDFVSTEEFEFKDVRAANYSPKYALKGTELTIEGKNLDVGNGAKIKVEGKLGPYVKDCPDRTSNRIRCMVPEVPTSGRYYLTTVLDGYELFMDGQLEYVEKPRIQNLIGRKTLTSFNKGGIRAEFRFSSLHGIQSVVLSVNNGTRENCELIEERSSVICPIPSLEAAETQSLRRSKRQDSVQSDPSGVARRNVSSKLVINDVTEIPLSDKFQLSYVDDPVIYDLQLIPCYNPDSTGDGGGTSTNESMVSVHLTGNHLADAAVAEDYTIVISGLQKDSTSVKCEPSAITSELLSCRSSVEKMREYEARKVKISVRSGNFTRVLETEYCPGGAGSPGFSNAVIGAIIVVVVILILIIVVLILLQRRRARKQQKEREQIMKLLDKLENKTRENARKAYFELQLGYMTTFTDNIGDRITYISPISCFMKAFFNNWKSDHPMLATKQIENIPNIKLAGVDDFAVLLRDKEFLILLVKTLEEQKHFTVKEKGRFASLLTVCLFDDMVYYTRVMMELLSDLIQRHVGKNPKLLLRRSESVVEKMVSHWLCINLYSECIKEQAGKPLFLMTKAIHFLVTSAPCDVIANKAVNSLNEMTLLGTEVTYEVMTLRASIMIGEKRSDVFEVKVVNCDTITQVKEKVIEAYYRDKPYSECPKPDKVQLELLVGGQGNLVLSDVDHMSHKEGNYTRINTLRHYNVPDGAEITLSPAKDDASEQAAEAGSPPPEPKKKRLYHLVDPRDKEPNGAVEEDDGGKGTKALIGNLINQPFQEIFLTRMVKSKSTVQEYVDNVFNAILNPSPISRCVKYLFQFLDKEAIKHKISDAEVLHIWKNNSLLLRYWVNILKNPEFLFDVNKTAIVDSCLNVITQAFMDACTTTSHKLGQDSPSNKLLYAKDSAKYKEMVAKFFVSVSNEESVSESEIVGILKDTSRKYAKDFNKQAAALELFSYVDRYRSQILEVIENDSLYSRLNETIRKISPDTNGHQTAYETSILV